jgi:hypothetical protein
LKTVGKIKKNMTEEQKEQEENDEKALKIALEKQKEVEMAHVQKSRGRILHPLHEEGVDDKLLFIVDGMSMPTLSSLCLEYGHPQFLRDVFKQESSTISLGKGDCKILQHFGNAAVKDANKRKDIKNGTKPDDLLFDGNYDFYVKMAEELQEKVEKEREEQAMAVNPEKIATDILKDKNAPTELLQLYTKEAYFVKEADRVPLISQTTRVVSEHFRDLGVQCLYMASRRARYFLHCWKPGERRKSPVLNPLVYQKKGTEPKTISETSNKDKKAESK